MVSRAIEHAATGSRMLNEPNGAIANPQADPTDEITLIFVKRDVGLPAKRRHADAVLHVRRGAG